MDTQVVKLMIKPFLPKIAKTLEDGVVDKILQSAKERQRECVTGAETVEIMITTEAGEEYLNLVALDNEKYVGEDFFRVRVLQQVKLSDFLKELLSII